MESSDAMKYAWPSTVGVANFVTVKPCVEGDERSDFKIWKRQMLCLLESQEVAGFVDGKILPPPEHEEHNRLMWRRTDMLVQGWILGTIGKDAIEAVLDKPTAREIWLELDNIFKEEEEVEEKKEVYGDENFTKYSPLYQAAMRDDWDTAETFFPDKNQLRTTVISSYSETILHIAVMTGKSNIEFVKKLVDLMPREALALKDANGDTALHNAAAVGNTEAAKVLVSKNSDLLYILNSGDRLAVLRATTYSQKETLKFLLTKHEEHEKDKPLFDGQTGISALNAIIASAFLNIASDLVKKYSRLALLMDEKFDNGRSALATLCLTRTLYTRIETLTWWQKFIYHRIPSKNSKSKYEAETTPVGDTTPELYTEVAKHTIISPPRFRSSIKEMGLKLETMIWHVIENLVPKVKGLREKKAQHQRAIKLAQRLCDEIVASLPEKEALIILKKSIMLAAKEGISEIVEMIIQKYPTMTCHKEPATGKTIFLLAATYRFENIINLLYNMSDRKYLSYYSTDDEKNNLMHICGKLAPPDRLNLVAGAALQMQRELQWFKIFTKEHKQLKLDGERWMKDTANACTIAAALIATIMFAAAFTVPGGLDSSTGIPLLSGEHSFMLFAISDAFSLFASITSLLMFLSILTSRYAEEDFLYVLPKRLSIGLLSLVVSITFMMVAFSATLYLLFRRETAWFLILLVAFACFPVTSFVLLQFPLLVDVLYSTYGPGIFGKKSNRVLY